MERHSFQLEVCLVKPGDADRFDSVHSEHDDGNHTSVAAVARNKEPATYHNPSLLVTSAFNNLY